MIDFALATGMRQGEIWAFKWSDIDEKAGTLTSMRKDKDAESGKSEHKIPLLEGVREVLLREFEKVGKVTRNRIRLPSRPDHVFGKPATSGAISDRFARVCKRVGIEGLTFHDLRHEGISRLFEDRESNYTIPQVAHISGHKKWETLRRYTQLNAENF